MPIRSPGDVPVGTTIRDLGLPVRAVSALTRAGVISIEDLAVLTRRELAAIPGLGPGTIAAIRLVVPEPHTNVARSGASSEAQDQDLAVPGTDPGHDPAEEEFPAAPAIPSFDSLRASRRRPAVDVLMPEQPPAPSAARRPGAGGPAPAGEPRPAEYADLLRFGTRVLRAAAGVPVRVGLWSVREPARCLRRMLGQRVGSRPAASEDSRLVRG